ncbi:zinc finger protein 184-like [Anopheles moucheti]|uniref:zinc finger protein 184-like n=1 Tax=Anopheles moucheti TaxID=186751 RepID=UPI0022F0A7DB|nr:zinc finger protein 184-like [Anopheles moucheti]XP_052898044.1 zinc finger protein 184-like [Anopheles moucheti]
MNRNGTEPIMNALKCRFCLEPHYPEAGSFSILNIPFSIALKRVFSFEVKSERHLPDYACKVCSAMVWQFYTYSVMVEDNQQKLQQPCSLLNAESPRNFAESYRIDGHEHVAIKREPVELSNSRSPVPSCSSNAAFDESSRHKMKAELQNEERTPVEIAVSRKVVSQSMTPPVSENDVAGNVKMEEREPIELSPVPTCSSNVVVEGNSHHSLKTEPQDEKSTPEEVIVSREVALEVMTPPVSENDDDGTIKLEEYVLQENTDRSNMMEGIADNITQEQQAEVPVANREVASVLENPVSANIEMEEQDITTHVEKSIAGIAEKVTQDYQAEDESSSTSDMMDYYKPADEPTEPDLSSASSSQGNAHDQTQTEESSLLLCDKCVTWFSDKRQLRNHQRMHKTSECPICKKMIKGDFISQHLAAHEGAFRCDICDATFASSTNLRIHEDMKHSADAQQGDEKFPCELCERRFHNKTQLSLHQKRHKMKQCYICKKQVNTTHFQNHISAHKGAFLCELCNRPFSSRSNLMNHKKVKHSPVYISCDRCGQTFPNLTKLTAHIKGHQRKQCPICKKEFRPNKIKEHLASHDGAFRCDNCRKTFSTKYSLNKHNRTSIRCRAESSDSDSEYELSPESGE